MNTKRLFTVIIVLLTVLTLAGCAAFGEPTPADGKTPTTEETPSNDKKPAEDKPADDKTPDGNEEEEVQPLPEGVTVAAPALDGENRIFKDLNYGTGARQNFDAYLPKNLNVQSGAAPVIVCVHGGAWYSGDKNEYSSITEFFNGYGYAVFSINYSFITEGSDYLDILDDVNDFMTYLKAYSSTFKIKTDRLAMMGTSAGAHICMLYGYKMNGKTPIPISLIVNQVGPADFTDAAFFDSAISPFDVASALLDETVTRESITTPSAKMLDASPVTHVTSTCPPTLSAYGKVDDIVPYSNGVTLTNKLTEAGVENKTYTYPNSGHGLNSPLDKAVADEFFGAVCTAVVTYLPVE